MKLKKRLLTMVICVALAATLLPMSVFADADAGSDEQTAEEVQVDASAIGLADVPAETSGGVSLQLLTIQQMKQNYRVTL